MAIEIEVYIVAGLVLLVLLSVLIARAWRYVLLLAGLTVGGLIAYAVAQQAAATRQVATTATVAAAGSAAGNLAAAVLAVLVVLLLLCGGGYVLVLRARLRRYELTGQRALTERLPADMIQQLIQLEVLRALSELRNAPRLVDRQPGAGALDNTDDGDGEADGLDVWQWWGL